MIKMLINHAGWLCAFGRAFIYQAIGIGNSLARNWRQSINWTNDEQVLWRHMTSLDMQSVNCCLYTVQVPGWMFRKNMFNVTFIHLIHTLFFQCLWQSRETVIFLNFNISTGIISVGTYIWRLWDYSSHTWQHLYIAGKHTVLQLMWRRNYVIETSDWCQNGIVWCQMGLSNWCLSTPVDMNHFIRICLPTQ